MPAGVIFGKEKTETNSETGALIGGGKGNCLAHSRLTAIPCFAARFYLSQNTPASARSR